MLRQYAQLRLLGSQCVSNALVVPSVLLGAACGVAEALTSEAGEAAASAIDELQAVLSEVLGHDAIKGFVLRPLLRLWRSRTEGRVLSIKLLRESGEGPAQQKLWAEWSYSATSVAELLQKHLQLRGEKAGEFVLHAGDVRAVTELRLACVRVAGGAPQAGPGLGAGSSQRAVDALRRLLAALGVTLGARCEQVDADDTVEDFALPFVPLVAVPRARCHERRRSEALPAAGEEKPELIAGLTPIAVDTLQSVAAAPRQLPALWQLPSAKPPPPQVTQEPPLPLITQQQAPQEPEQAPLEPITQAAAPGEDSVVQSRGGSAGSVPSGTPLPISVRSYAVELSPSSSKSLGSPLSLPASGSPFAAAAWQV